MTNLRTNHHFVTLMLFFACSGSLSGVEGGGGGGGGCQDPACASGDGRCKTADGGQMMTIRISGKITSAESSCQEPLADEEVRLYTGCARSKYFNAEPAAGWKTGTDGTFEVSVPLQPGTGPLRTELCLTGRRGCRPLTLNVPAQRSPSSPRGVRYAAAAGATSISDGQGEAREGDKAVRVTLCLGEKKRRRRLAGWDDRDMGWLRKKSTAEENDGAKKKNKERQDDPAAGGRKRGWSNGIPWLKRPHPSPASSSRRSAAGDEEKRLWEGADDEVGWIKRHSMMEDDDDDEKERPGENNNLPPNDDGDDRRDMSAADDDDDDGRSVKPRPAAAGRWPRPEEMKKYWAQSDVSWL